MDMLTDWVSLINGVVWGPAMLVLLAGTGLYLTIGLQLQPWRRIGFALRALWTGRRATETGDISPFQALMTSLSATIGTGNIAGVATAIALGGPGALFWMWCIALVGMATKFAEAVCAVQYRERDARGHYVGGPMYYIKNGLGPHWKWLGVLFAVFGMLAGFGIGNTVQSNSVADALASSVQLPKWITGFTLCICVGLVLVGGLQRLAKVAERLVPLMSICYLVAALCIVLWHVTELPGVIVLVCQHAFSPIAATGGFTGATVWLALRYGVARGVFSNEAGLGSAPIAHAAARTKQPVQQGFIAMLGTFFDTLIICTMTGFVILVTGAWTTGENGAALTTTAFASALPGLGQYIVSFSLAVFAFTTILGWSYYSERCAEYLFGVNVVKPFRVLWVLAVPVGVMVELDFIWLLADTLNALMAIPNLIALIALSPVIFKLTKEYLGAKASNG